MDHDFLIISAFSIVLAATPLAAEEATGRLDIETMVEQLVPSNLLGRSRSIKSQQQPQSRAVVLGVGNDAGAGSGWIPDLKVTFAFDSAELNADARNTLDRLAAALQDKRLAIYSFEIAGHTDASGNEIYNLALSERRATAVVDYLVRQRGIDVGRLSSHGYGESEPINPEVPNASENRRVEIVTTGG